MEYLVYLLQFLILFLISFLYYRLIALKGIEKKKTKDKNKELPEVKLFILLNKIDLRKANYIKIAKQLTTLISISLAITVMLTFHLSDNIFAKIGIGVLSLIITSILSYKLLGFIYKKKGLIKDVQS